MRRALAKEALYSSDEYDLHTHQFGSSMELTASDVWFNVSFENASDNVRRFDPLGIKALATLYEIERGSI